ncbi:MAG TPA: alpha-L-rhamnosidase C-terminal domain-containing protein [Terracidiphilus sp.]|nr:alpha-L-rhamnosidase C-terminal domain-containing protein [Terracidiphilus sp.]
MRSVLTTIAIAFAILAVHTQAQTLAQTDGPHRDWQTSWVTHPTAPLREPLVLHFRRALTLGAIPASYPVRVSADNRFVLFVNGQRVGDGPARGDLTHWRYERFDLAPLLHSGKNLITATVWNWGILAPIAQMSDRTAFLLESEATGAEGISTPEGWQVEIEPGHRAMDRSTVDLKTYFASGPGEEINAALYDWNWQLETYAGSNWVAVATPMRDSVHEGVNKAHSADTTGDNFWGLVPDGLPHMEYSPTSASTTVRVDVVNRGAIEPEVRQFPAAPVTVPAGSHVHILLDRKTLTTAYPILTVSGGKGAQVRLTYSEALYDKEIHKGDRDEVGDRTARGLKDSFLPDGGEHRVFEPLWWRTWRYLDLDVETAGEPLTLESLGAQFTAYPFEERATFQSDDAELKKIWEISWRTARLDAHETYMDTPYYEQLQYVGDTRIQALISYSVAGDDRLARQALEAFNDSRFPDGITRSRYPSSLAQTIPTFSLLWVGMVRDYWMYRPDPEPAKASIAGTQTVMDWFARYEQPDGLLKQLPWWSFIDWVPSGTIPTYDAKGESCATTLEYLGALEDAAALERGLGDPLRADRYQARAEHVRTGLYDHCWSGERGLIADTPDKKNFSQQANILGVLYDVVPKERRNEVLRQMLAVEPGTTPDGVLSASYYFRYYLARALEHTGTADLYLSSIDPWRKLLPLHFSTWPEIPGDTRSDSHAWTSHPIYDLLTLVAGIEPASPGFARVRIAPHMGALPSLTATYPHPEGTISVKYTREGSGLNANITLPGKLSGSFVFNGKEWPLRPGVNAIQAR